MAFQPLTEEQYNKAIQAGFSHDQILQNEQQRKQDQIALEPSGGGFWRGVGNFLGQTVPDYGVGIAKSIPKAIKGASDLGQKIFDPLTNFITNSKPVGQYSQAIPPSLYTGKNKAEQAGIATGETAQLLAPTGLETKGAGLVTKAAEGALEFGGKTAVQTGGNVKQTATATVLGGAFPIASKVMESALPGFANWLEKINLRLSPVQKQNLGKDLQEVTNYLSKEKLVGTPEMRFEKIGAIYDDMESKLQKFLDTNNTKIAPVSKQGLLDELEGLKSSYRNERDVLAIEKQIDEVKNTLSLKYREKIPIARLNELKRSTYNNAYNRAGDKVIDSVEHDIGSVFQKNIEQVTKGLKIEGKDIGAFNKEYGTVIKTRRLLKIAASRPQLGLMGKLTSGAIGGGVARLLGGGAIPEGVGAAIGLQSGEMLMGTPTRSALSAGAMKLNELTPKIPGAVKKATKAAIIGKFR